MASAEVHQAAAAAEGHPAASTEEQMYNLVVSCGRNEDMVHWGKHGIAKSVSSNGLAFEELEKSLKPGETIYYPVKAVFGVTWEQLTTGHSIPSYEGKYYTHILMPPKPKTKTLDFKRGSLAGPLDPNFAGRSYDSCGMTAEGLSTWSQDVSMSNNSPSASGCLSPELLKTELPQTGTSTPSEAASFMSDDARLRMCLPTGREECETPPPPVNTPGELAFVDPPVNTLHYETAKAVIFPIPYDETCTYLKGTAKGPEAIIDASTQVELWDEEFLRETSDVGIFTLNPIVTELPPAPEKLHLLTQPECERLINDGKFVLSLGGEHTISLGPILAHRAKWPDMAVLHFDAHTDMRDEYEGTHYGHGCFMRRVAERGVPLVQVGIRSLSKEEYDWITPNPSIKTFYAWKTLPDLSKHFEEIVAALPQHVYITVDMDAFDPSVAPGVGTPEPGGLMYHDVVGLIRAVAKDRTIVGADINEVRPIEDQVQTEFTAARLAYKIIGFVSRQNKWFDQVPEGGVHGPAP